MKEQANFRATELGSVLASEGRKARWLADQVGISESHLSRIVSGERRLPESLARRIADAVNRPLFLLFELTLVSESDTLERVA